MTTNNNVDKYAGHTPGPWHVVRDKHTGTWIQQRTGTIRVARIAGGTANPLPAGVAGSTALIADAPELLATCREMRAVIRQMLPDVERAQELETNDIEIDGYNRLLAHARALTGDTTI